MLTSSRHGVFETFQRVGYNVRPSVENRRKRFVAGRSRRGFYRVAKRKRMREPGPERGRRETAGQREMYKGVKAGRGRNEIDTAGEVWRFSPFRHELRNFHPRPILADSETIGTHSFRIFMNFVSLLY